MELKYRCKVCGNNLTVEAESADLLQICTTLPECGEATLVTPENDELVLPSNPQPEV